MTLDSEDRPPSLPGPVRAAADALTSTIEEQANEIVSAAQQRAIDLEREANDAVRRIKHDAERQAERILQVAFERAQAALDSVHVIESGLTGMAYGLRLEADHLASTLTSAADGGAPQLSPGPVASHPEAPDGHEDRAGFAGSPAAAEPGPPVITATQLRRVVRAIVGGMKREGRPREDAHRFLMNFGLEGSYGELLDQIYAPPDEEPVVPRAGGPRKRGLRRGPAR